MIVVDAHEKIVLWNPAATRIFGYSEEEALGSTLDLIVPERQRHRHNEGCRKSMDTGITRYGTSLLKVPALHKSGSILSIAFTVGMLFDEHQKVNGIAALPLTGGGSHRVVLRLGPKAAPPVIFG